MMESKHAHRRHFMLGLNFPLQPGIPGSPCNEGFDTSSNFSNLDNCVYFGNNDQDNAMGIKPLVIQPIAESEMDSDPQQEVTDIKEEYVKNRSTPIKDFKEQASIEQVESKQDSNPQPEILDVQQEHLKSSNSYMNNFKEKVTVEKLELSDDSENLELPSIPPEVRVNRIETIAVAVKDESGDMIKEEILQVELNTENGIYENIPASDDRIDSSVMVEDGLEGISNDHDTSEEFGETGDRPPKEFRDLFADGRYDSLSKAEKIRLTKRTKFCYECKILFKTGNETAVHMKQHHSNKYVTKLFKCKICKNRIKTFNGMKLHIRKHFKTGYYPCGVCDKTFRSEQWVKKHFRTHEKENYKLK